MKFYDLCSDVTLQGNIEIDIYEDGKEVGNRYFRDETGFDSYSNDCEDLDDYEVFYMYCDSNGWLVIEVHKD